MDRDNTFKMQLPLKPTPHIMELLIKAKYFLEHAKKHALSKNDFDAMIAIHSLDNSIEYLLRILVKHLEIEENTGKRINTSELMGLFGEIDKYLSEYAVADGKVVKLPFINEIKQLRELRNNVQHGLILPINEINAFINYGEAFFNKVLAKIFGLKLQEVAYSTLIENEDIKKHLVLAESKITEGNFLLAIVACRDAFELSEFLLRQNSHHYSKMAMLPYLKKESTKLYYYVLSLEREISILETGTNSSDYRLYRKYIDHIPGKYRVEKSGYSLMQREWNKSDADFCYSFVSRMILCWQITQERPLYEADISNHQVKEINKTISGVAIPELYPEKSCIYIEENNTIGELILIGEEVKKELQDVLKNKILLIENRIVQKGSTLLLKDCKEYVIVDAYDFNLILNNGSLWELTMFYRTIPFTSISNMDEQIDIDCIGEYDPKDKIEEQFKELVIKFGIVNTIERAWELYDLLGEERYIHIYNKGFFSSHLIDVLNRT